MRKTKSKKFVRQGNAGRRIVISSIVGLFGLVTLLGYQHCVPAKVAFTLFGASQGANAASSLGGSRGGQGPRSSGDRLDWICLLNPDAPDCQVDGPPDRTGGACVRGATTTETLNLTAPGRTALGYNCRNDFQVQFEKVCQDVGHGQLGWVLISCMSLPTSDLSQCIPDSNGGDPCQNLRQGISRTGPAPIVKRGRWD